MRYMFHLIPRKKTALTGQSNSQKTVHMRSVFLFENIINVPAAAAAAGIMTRKLGAELDPLMTAVLNKPGAPVCLPRTPNPSILR